MKLLTLLLLLFIPLYVSADTEEIDLDEEIPILPPVKRDFVPTPKMYVIDKSEIQIEYYSEDSVGGLTITDTKQKTVFAADYLDSNYCLPTLTEGEVYSIQLYIGNMTYSGIYIP